MAQSNWLCKALIELIVSSGLTPAPDFEFDLACSSSFVCVPCFHSVRLIVIPWLGVADIWTWETVKKRAVQLKIDIQVNNVNDSDSRAVHVGSYESISICNLFRLGRAQTRTDLAY